MGETTRQIATHIDNAREDLGSNLQELEQKVKSVTDWRQQFRNNPMMMVGLAFGGGVFLATMAGGRRNRLSGMSSPATAPSTSESSTKAIASRGVANRETQQVLETWDNIKGALVGVAASRLKSFLGESIPGFQEQLSKTENDSTRSFEDRPASSTPGSASFAASV
jgi:hypothetical protein